MPAQQHHADSAKNKGQRRQQSGLSVTYTEVLDDRRQEEGNTVACRVQTEVHYSAEQYARIGESLKQGQMLDLFLVALFGCLHVLQPRNLIPLQPVRLVWKVGEIEHHAEADEN